LCSRFQSFFNAWRAAATCGTLDGARSQIYSFFSDFSCDFLTDLEKCSFFEEGQSWGCFSWGGKGQRKKTTGNMIFNVMLFLSRSLI